MHIPSLLATLAFVTAGFAAPAIAAPSLDAPTAAAQTETLPAEACLAKAKGNRLAQIDCCKGHKGLCGCRAGKIVCCDGTASNEPGCTCHGDDSLTQ